MDFGPTRPTSSAKENFAATGHGRAKGAVEADGSEETGSDAALGAVLNAIDRDVNARSEASRIGIVAEFAARIAYARKYLPRNQVSAAVAAIVQVRKAALAILKQTAAQERAGRKKAAMLAWRRLRIIALEVSRRQPAP